MLAVRRLVLSMVMLGLAATLTTVPQAVGAGTAAQPSAAQTTTAKKPSHGFTPPSGALLSDPTIGGRKRVVLNQVIRSVRNTAKGEYVRAAVWNYDDRAVTNALIDAHQRGVHVQVVVANTVSNANWSRTAAALNKNRKDRSFAVRCRGGCRSAVHPARQVRTDQPGAQGEEHQHGGLLQPDHPGRLPPVERPGHPAQQGVLPLAGRHLP